MNPLLTEARDMTVAHIVGAVLTHFTFVRSEADAEQLRPAVMKLAVAAVDKIFDIDLQEVAHKLAQKAVGPVAWLARKVPQTEIVLSAEHQMQLRVAAFSMVARDAPAVIIEAIEKQVTVGGDR